MWLAVCSVCIPIPLLVQHNPVGQMLDADCGPHSARHIKYVNTEVNNLLFTIVAKIKVQETTEPV